MVTSMLILIKTFFYFRARIVDFHQPACNNTHPLLFEWVCNYFQKNRKADGTSQALPLYLQHQGKQNVWLHWYE